MNTEELPHIIERLFRRKDSHPELIKYLEKIIKDKNYMENKYVIQQLQSMPKLFFETITSDKKKRTAIVICDFHTSERILIQKQDKGTAKTSAYYLIHPSGEQTVETKESLPKIFGGN